eukprot:1931713-Pleurochrysis_carterae.AAC.1
MSTLFKSSRECYAVQPVNAMQWSELLLHSVAHECNASERIDQVIELCKVNSENRLLYQNVW